MSFEKYPLVLLILVLIFAGWSGFSPQDTRLTWILEVFPVAIALPILLLTYKKFPLTYLCYTLIAIHAVILMLGAHYSYASTSWFWMESGLVGLEIITIKWTFNARFGPAIYVRNY